MNLLVFTLLSNLFITINALGTGVCPRTVNGDGMGGDEKLISDKVNSLQECLDLVKAIKGANGLTVSSNVMAGETGLCYAEFDMVESNHDKDYKTCMFALPQSLIASNVLTPSAKKHLSLTQHLLSGYRPEISNYQYEHPPPLYSESNVLLSGYTHPLQTATPVYLPNDIIALLSETPSSSKP